jgi:hypothetical protein
MRLSRWIAVSLLPAAAVLTGARSTSPSNDPTGDHVRRHLDSVLVELRATNSSTLRTPQQVRRARLIEELAAYRNRGAFPHNYDFPGQLVPYFRDRKTGALCAVGDLLAATNRLDIVDRVVRADNNVRVAQLAGDTAFRHWLDDNGLTLAEAARIQVVYASSVTPEQIVGTVLVAGASPVLSVISLDQMYRNSTSNADGHRTGLANGSLFTGLLNTAAGVALLHSSAVPRWAGLVTTSIGVANVFVSGASIRQHNLGVERERKANESRATVSFAPTIDPGVSGRGPSIGAAVGVQF